MNALISVVLFAACRESEPGSPADTEDIDTDASDTAPDSDAEGDTDTLPDICHGETPAWPGGTLPDLAAACWLGEGPAWAAGRSVHAREGVVAIGTRPYEETIAWGRAYADDLHRSGPYGLDAAPARILGEKWAAGFGYTVRVGATGLIVAEPFLDTQSGQVHVFSPSVGHADQADAQLTITETHPVAMFGTSLCEWDADGDGTDEIVAGSPNADDHQTTPGEVRAYASGLTGRVSADAWSTRLVGETDFDRAGQTLACGGDADGDGLDDLLVGAVLGDSPAGLDAGDVYLVLAPATGAAALADIASLRLTGEGAADLASAGLAFAGDPDGDGYDDVLVGAHWATNGGTGAGRAYYFRSPAAGVLSVATADAILTGDRPYRGVGRAVAGLGDFTGDGADDIAIAAPGDIRTSGNEAEVYVFGGPLAGALSRDDAFVLGGASPDDLAGAALAGAPDLDGDGRAELVVGAPYDDHAGTDAGIAYLVHGFSW